MNHIIQLKYAPKSRNYINEKFEFHRKTYGYAAPNNPFANLKTDTCNIQLYNLRNHDIPWTRSFREA